MGTFNQPSIVVEIAFGYTWDDTSPSWTDVSAYLREASWLTGRDSEFDQFSPGSLTVVLDNTDRRFDPLYSTGPYFGNLKPNVPIRVRALHEAAYYGRFYGYVDAFAQEYDQSNEDATCVVAATDAFKILDQLELPSAYSSAVLADTPKLYWKLGEADGFVAADSSGNRYDGTYSALVRRGETALAKYTGDAAAGFTGLSNQVVVGPAGSRIDTYPFTLEGWWAASTPSSTAQRPLIFQRGGTSSIHCNLLLGYDSASDIFIILYTYNSTGPVDIIKSWTVSNAYDGQPHHFMCVVDDAVADCVLYVDGAPATDRATGTGNSAVASFGGWNVGAFNDYFTTFNGTIDDVAVYTSALTAADAAAHYAAGTSPNFLDPTGTRVGRVLDLIGWPAALRSIDTGENICGPANYAGTTALEYLQAVAATEQGRLFVDGDGKITFHARDRFYTQSTETTAQATFSDDGSDLGYSSLSFAYDDQYIYNVASVTREGGVAQVSENTTSQASYGKRGKSLSGLLLADDRASRAVADHYVARYGSPQIRPSAIVFKPETIAQWTTVMPLRIGYRINVERTPQATGSAIDFDCHIESIKETVTHSEYILEITASPADTRVFFTWGGDNTTQGWGTTGVWR